MIPFSINQQHLALLILLICCINTPITATLKKSHREQEQKQETTDPNSNPSQWYMDHNHFPYSTSHRTCIIVQDSAPGPAVEVLDATSRVNRAYAKRWNHDYLKFTGVALGSKPWQATFNKPFLLSNLLRAWASKNMAVGKESSGGDTSERKRYLQHDIEKPSNATEVERVLFTVNDMGIDLQAYDTVLFLDSNAMIVQLDYDVLDLISQDKMLAMVGNTNGEIRRSKYSDVMLWNLQHPHVMSVSNSWIETSQTNLHDENADSQTLLMNVLQNEVDGLDGSDSENLLDPIPGPYVDGLQGTVIKQDSKYTTQVVEQSDLPQIMPVVQGIADSVCYRFYPQCEVV